MQGGAGRHTGLSARRARRTKSRGYSRPRQTMAGQSILKSAVLPASPMPLFVSMGVFSILPSLCLCLCRCLCVCLRLCLVWMDGPHRRSRWVLLQSDEEKLSDQTKTNRWWLAWTSWFPFKSHKVQESWSLESRPLWLCPITKWGNLCVSCIGWTIALKSALADIWFGQMSIEK